MWMSDPKKEKEKVLVERVNAISGRSRGSPNWILLRKIKTAGSIMLNWEGELYKNRSVSVTKYGKKKPIKTKSCGRLIA